ncbi:hypothetical protein TNCV_122271 [Trichonephila clavipes]|nr:hypothetical protein TNCV_122271 [Trichonephila clavipes]
MEVPLRTAYGQNGRYGMQPKARQSSRAGAAKTRTETCEIVEEKQKLLDIREKEERESADKLILGPASRRSTGSFGTGGSKFITINSDYVQLIWAPSQALNG